MMTSPNFYNAFSSGENLSKERFLKSRENAVRKNYKNRETFNSGPMGLQMEESKRPEKASSIFCAPMIQTSPQNPFKEREYDGGERAASDEQGGSSMRSGSPNSCRSPLYLGDGVINISQEILNSNDSQSNIANENSRSVNKTKRNRSFVSSKKGKSKLSAHQNN